MAFPPATPVVDGTTVLGNAWWTAFLAELTSALQDAGHPTVTPAAAIAELIAARGSLADLDTRLLRVVGHNGENLANVAPAALRNGFVWGNPAFNAGHVMWSRGDAAAPDGWTVSGAGAVIARCGSGQADTNVLSASDTVNFSAKLTYGSATARLTQEFLPTSPFLMTDTAFWEHAVPVDADGNFLPGFNGDELPALYVLAAVRCDGTNRARISIGDNAAVGSNLSYSNYHPGDSAFKWLLAGPYNVNAFPSAGLNIQGHVENAGSAHFMHWMICPSTSGLPPTFLPEYPIRRSEKFQTANNPATTAGLFYWSPDKPVIVMGARLGVSAAPTVGACTVDLLTPIGGVYSSMFVTPPAIAATKFTKIQACDPAAANYRRRCIRGIQTDAAASLPDNSQVRIDYTDDAGGTTRDLVIIIDYLEFPRPFEQWRAQTDLGE